MAKGFKSAFSYKGKTVEFTANPHSARQNEFKAGLVNKISLTYKINLYKISLAYTIDLAFYNKYRPLQ